MATCLQFWFPFEFDKQSGSVSLCATAVPHSGCARPPWRGCTGQLCIGASGGDPSPDARTRA